MITLSCILADVKYSRAFLDVDGRLIGLPLTKEQEREFTKRVGKPFVVTVAEVGTLVPLEMEETA